MLCSFQYTLAATSSVFVQRRCLKQYVICYFGLCLFTTKHDVLLLMLLLYPILLLFKLSERVSLSRIYLYTFEYIYIYGKALNIVVFETSFCCLSIVVGVAVPLLYVQCCKTHSVMVSTQTMR